MTRVEPAMAAAFALHGRPGAYAALIGSGMSSGAGIPTGWKIVEDLVRRIAAVEGADVGDDAAAWYQARFGMAPTYSGLLAALALTKADRQALILNYVGPDPDTGARMPTAGHRALARLVAGGWIRVIVTTNFDRLIEQALAEAGVTATVLASEDAVRGAVPLAHAGVVVLKLHGDHLDPRIRNTDVELDEYGPATNSLLDRIFDEYGLIVCGWSADHDSALVRALDRCQSRRFTTFWAVRGSLSSEAEALVNRRDAETVPVVDADAFFGGLADACEALKEFERPHPLTVDAAVVTAKRELAGQHPAIPLHDMIQGEVTRIRHLDPYIRPEYNGGGDRHLQRLAQLETEMELLLALVATAAYWGTPATDRWWMGEIERFSFRKLVSGETAFINLPRVPAVAILWTGGVAAVAADRSDLLVTLLRLPPIDQIYTGQPLPAALVLSPDVLHAGDALKRLRRLLRRSVVDHLGLSPEVFVDAWERWQYVLTVMAWDSRLHDNVGADFYPHIRAEAGFDTHAPVPEAWFRSQLGALGTSHPLIAGGLFGGDTQRLEAAMQAFGESFSSFTEREDWAAVPPGGGMLPTDRHYPGRLDDDPEA